MESMSEYMEIWKRDEVVFSHFQVWCKDGLFMTILRCWDFMRRWNEMFMGKVDMGIQGSKVDLWTKGLIYELKIA